MRRYFISSSQIIKQPAIGRQNKSMELAASPRAAVASKIIAKMIRMFSSFIMFVFGYSNEANIQRLHYLITPSTISKLLTVKAPLGSVVIKANP